jgi:hypothetical protein
MARASSKVTPTSSSTTKPHQAQASVFWRAGVARVAKSPCAASPTPTSGRCTKRTTACFTMRCRWNTSTCATGTRATWSGRKSMASAATRTPSSSTSTPNFCRAFAARRRANARANSHQTHLRKRVETYFDPLPFYYAPLEEQATDTAKYPLNAITQRPMAMYHSWDSQNAWLRQIHTHNYLFVNPKTASCRRHYRWRLDVGGVAMGQGALHVPLFRSGGARHGLDLERHRQICKGAWNLTPDANESQRGFLLNHLISEELPPSADGATFPTPTPSPARPPGTTCGCASTRRRTTSPQQTFPQFKAVPAAPGVQARLPRWQAYFAGKGSRNDPTRFGWSST